MFSKPSRRNLLNDLPRLAEMRRGFKLVTRDNEFTSLWFRLYGCYEKRTIQAIARELGPNATLLDVGANLGIFSVDLATNTNCSVIAFEPNPGTAARLRESIKLNQVDHQIHLRENAVGDTTGKVSFLDNSENAGDSALLQEGNQHKAGSIITVDVVALDGDAALQELISKLPPIKAVKMDVQGAEVSALRGMKNLLAKYRPLLVIEVCEDSLAEFSSSKDALFSLLRDFGYRAGMECEGNVMFIPE